MKKQNPSIKIFVTYKEKHKVIKSDIITPIQTGRAIADEVFAGMLGDDTGDNISVKNPLYSELSAQYWVWKNYDKIGNPDYVGFMHYRRHFIFDDWTGSPKNTWVRGGNVYNVPVINDAYMEHLQDKYIYDSIKDTDIIVLKAYDLKNMGKNTIRDNYFCRHVEQFDVFIDCCKKLYPEYIDAIEKIEKGSVQYLCNMFIMRKDLFLEYSDFCFSVLNEVEKHINTEEMDESAERVCGYLGEFLLSMYIFHKKVTDKNIRITELNGSYILSDEPVKHPLLRYIYYWFLSKCVFQKDKLKKIKQRRKIYKLIFRAQAFESRRNTK